MEQAISILPSQLQALVTEAAKLGAEQGIQASLKNTQTDPLLPTDINIKQVTKLTGLGATAIWRRNNKDHKLHDPTFPKPFKKGNGKTNFWSLAEVQEWNEKQKQTRESR